jgi:hypothetical protein
MIICKDKDKPKLCEMKKEKTLKCGHVKIVECEKNLNHIKCDEPI